MSDPHPTRCCTGGSDCWCWALEQPNHPAAIPALERGAAFADRIGLPVLIDLVAARMAEVPRA